MIRLLAILCGVLLLAGCGERVRVNPEAELGFYWGSTQWMHARLPPGAPRATSYLRGYYDPADGSITLNEQLRSNPVALLEAYSDELGHAVDHQRPPTLWALLRRYESPRFRPISHPPEELARLIAACATLPPPDPHAPPSR